MIEPAVVHFCPECGSASVTLSALAGGVAACKACEWSGLNTQLAAMPVRHELGDEGQITRALVGDLRSFLAKEAGLAFARFLQKWGFIDMSKTDVVNRLLARYLAAMARGILNSILEERQKIEKERVHGS